MRGYIGEIVGIKERKGSDGKDKQEREGTEVMEGTGKEGNERR